MIVAGVRYSRFAVCKLLSVAVSGILIAFVAGCNSATPTESGALRLAVNADDPEVDIGAPAAFTVTASRRSPDPVLVEYMVERTASGGSNSTESGSTTLAAGAEQARIAIAPLYNARKRASTTTGQVDVDTTPATPTGETIAVALTGASTATGQVEVDTEAAIVAWAGPPGPSTPQLWIDDGGAAEDAGSISFRVLLYPWTPLGLVTVVTVSYQTEDGTATAGPGSDYTSTAGELTFTPGGPREPGGALEQSILVEIADDSEDEPDYEYFTVRLHSPVNAELPRRAEATGTIIDNDAAVQ